MWLIDDAIQQKRLEILLNRGIYKSQIDDE
jgi:hypothetical protein